MSKDWVGNNKAIYTALGASSHALEERESNDFYATEPKAVELLIQEEKFSNHILEPFCGTGHISNVLKEAGYEVLSSDLIDRGYGEVKDFFEYKSFAGDVVSNPPYKIALECVKHCLDIVDEGHKVVMFLKIQFLEGQERRKFFEKNPPKTIYVASKRLSCAKNGEFEKYPSSAVCYAWFVWEKGFKGSPSIKWIN